MHQLGDFAVPSADRQRELSVRISGNRAGFPVFFLHGTPGSRIGPIPRPQVLYKLGVLLISYDRPGYGGSHRHKFRQVVAAADDVLAIADHLNIDRFGVIGRSGGGPHALACAALHPERVTSAGVLVSLAPMRGDGMGEHWFNGMTHSNVTEYRFAATNHEELTWRLAQATDKITADPASHVSTLSPEMPLDDRRVVADAGIRSLLAQNFAEGLRESADGWVDDVLAFCAPWGFDPADIGIPVRLWHGRDDVFSPVDHTRWLAHRIPGSQLVIQQDSAHFAALEAVPDMLSWLIRPVLGNDQDSVAAEDRRAHIGWASMSRS